MVNEVDRGAKVHGQGAGAGIQAHVASAKRGVGKNRRSDGLAQCELFDDSLLRRVDGMDVKNEITGEADDFIAEFDIKGVMTSSARKWSCRPGNSCRQRLPAQVGQEWQYCPDYS